MAEIISYPVNTTVLETDLLLGTHVPQPSGSKPTSTKNFTVGSIVSLAQAGIPSSQDLQSVLDNGSLAELVNPLNTSSVISIGFNYSSEEGNNNAYISSEKDDKGGSFNVENGEAIVTQQDKPTGITSSLRLETPVTNSNYFVPAKTLAGTYVLATLDDIDNRPYKVYTALLTQSGTNAPVATVLENTLGFTPTWIYSDVGTYQINNALFTENKTTVNVFLNVNGNNYSFPSTVFGSNIVVTSVFLFDYTYMNGILNNTAIEIRVYN